MDPKNLNDFPVELLVRIFEYQSSNIELRKISMVCKKWRDIVEEFFKYSEKIFLSSRLLSIYIEHVDPKNNLLTDQKKSLIRNYKCLSLPGEHYESVEPYIKTLDLKFLRISKVPFSKVLNLLEIYKKTLETLDFQFLSQDSGCCFF